MTSLAHHLLGQTRSRVLSALLLHPERALHVRELARVAQTSPGSLHRDLRALADLGLLVRQDVGRQVTYQANAQSPVFAELAGLLRKTAGLADVLRDALAPLGDAVALAFVYGSMADGTARPGSDVDVMVLGDAGFADTTLALAHTAAALGREVNPTPMTVQDFARRLNEGDGFARSVVESPRIWLKGEEHDFAKLVAHRAPEGTRSHSGGGSAPAGGG
ncbi:MAG: nucleotidyltransferase domain-containing protein [Hydrogenophaga sp.]|jgi:predicted nucleotidyltransferase|nr:nucleotidyltransferase domain-containing protein [Hydrogenophaga sp.]